MGTFIVNTCTEWKRSVLRSKISFSARQSYLQRNIRIKLGSTVIPSRLTPTERASIVIEYARTPNGREAAQRFKRKFGHGISHNTPADVFRRFRAIGSTEDWAHVGRSATVNTEANQLAVRDSVVLGSTLSQRRRSLQLTIRRFDTAAHPRRYRHAVLALPDDTARERR